MALHVFKGFEEEKKNNVTGGKGQKTTSTKDTTITNYMGIINNYSSFTYILFCPTFNEADISAGCLLPVASTAFRDGGADRCNRRWSRTRIYCTWPSLKHHPMGGLGHLSSRQSASEQPTLKANVNFRYMCQFFLFNSDPHPDMNKMTKKRHIILYRKIQQVRWTLDSKEKRKYSFFRTKRKH